MARRRRRTPRRGPAPTQNLGLRFTLWTLRLIRAAIRAVIQLAWEVFTDQFRAASQGIAGLVKKTVPWVIGLLVLLFLTKNDPQGARILFGYAVAIGFLVWGFRILLRKFFK